MPKPNRHFYKEREGDPELEPSAIRLATNLLLDVAGKRKKVLVIQRDEQTGNLVEAVSQKTILCKYREDNTK